MVRRFEGPETRAADVLEAQRNVSLFEPVALIVIRRCGKLPKAEADFLASAFAEESREGEPPVVLTDTTIDRRLKLHAGIARAGGSVEIGSPNRGDAKRWVVAEANRLGHRLASGGPDAIVEALGTDLLQIRRALEVVSLGVGVGEGKPIGLDDIGLYVPGSRSHATYELQDALTDRDGGRAVRLLRAVIDEGLEVPVIVGSLFAVVRRLRLAVEFPRGIDPRSAAAALSVPDFRAQSLLAGARGFSRAALDRAIERLARMDVAFKTGQGRPAVTLEEWVIELCRS